MGNYHIEKHLLRGINSKISNSLISTNGSRTDLFAQNSTNATNKYNEDVPHHSNSLTKSKSQRLESKKIDAYLAQEKIIYEQLQKEPKLLVLGPSDSGKSTFIKQLKILYGNGFTNEELLFAKQQCLSNILNYSELFISKCNNDIQTEYESIVDFAACNNGPFDCFPSDLANSIDAMWKNHDIKVVVAELGQNIPITTPFFFDKIKILAQKEYHMTNEDMLLLRRVTTCISDIVLTVENSNIHFYDVSGLKHHRKQWIPYFQDTLSIIFIVDISCYDQTMVEDNSINRMVDSLELFQFIVTHPLLTNPDVFLFFNKSDLFQAKIKRVYLDLYFPEFKGKRGSAKDALRFFEDLFKSKETTKKRFISVNLTSNTDTNAMKSITSDLL
ncbi:hypothetical protein HDV02_003327 [Globomyces sp. JEL0801]|nr:hypothetical protein HDV02_003327 [Globomyces sp. JEL0801]